MNIRLDWFTSTIRLQLDNWQQLVKHFHETKNLSHSLAQRLQTRSRFQADQPLFLQMTAFTSPTALQTSSRRPTLPSATSHHEPGLHSKGPKLAMELSSLLSSSESTSTLDESPLWPELRFDRDDSGLKPTMLTGWEMVRTRFSAGGDSSEMERIESPHMPTF